MKRRQWRAVVGSLMVVLGVMQAVWGVARSDLVFAGFGLGYAVLGGLYLWFEVFRTDR